MLNTGRAPPVHFLNTRSGQVFKNPTPDLGWGSRTLHVGQGFYAPCAQNYSSVSGLSGTGLLRRESLCAKCCEFPSEGESFCTTLCRQGFQVQGEAALEQTLEAVYVRLWSSIVVKLWG